MLSDAMMQNLFGLVAGLLGAAVGGFFTLYATYQAIRAQDAKDEQQEEKEIHNLLDAIRVEIDALWGFHMQRVGGLVEALAEGQALEFYYPLTQDYFVIYDRNADKLGQIRDAALRTSIVITYNKCKKVVDGFKYNNQLYRDYRELQVTDNGSVQDAERIRRKYIEMCDYGKIIQSDHYELKSYIENLLTLLEAPL